MRMRTGVAWWMGIVSGFVSAGCGNEHPTAARVGAERRHAGERLPGGYFQNGENGGVTTQSDTITRGIGGFGSGN